MRDNLDMRIADLIEKHNATEFKWGEFDCSQFAVEALNTLHGFNVTLAPYSTQKEARKVFKKTGGTFEDALQGFGLIKQPPAMAKRGDLVTVQNDDSWGTAVALVVGLTAVCPSNMGLKSVPRNRWIQSWGVPCRK